jgi:hypothetical protein
VLLQVMLASDLLWHINGREATAAVGYDVTLRQARLQGKIDSTGNRKQSEAVWTPVRGVGCCLDHVAVTVTDNYVTTASTQL